MPINPIDFATMAPKSQEVSQIQQNMIRHETRAAEVVESQVANQVIHESQTTRKTNHEEKLAFHKEGQGEKGESRQQKKKQEKEKDEKMAPSSNSSFDIKI